MTYPVGSSGFFHGGPEAGKELGTTVDGASWGMLHSFGNRNRASWRQGSRKGEVEREGTHVEKHTRDVDERGEEEEPMAPQDKGEEEAGNSLQEGAWIRGSEVGSGHCGRRGSCIHGERRGCPVSPSAPCPAIA